MGFYGYEPFDEAKATYVWTGVGGPGFFSVEVSGEAPNFTYGIQLVRDPHFVCGLKVDVMGWTGPIGEGKTPYSVHRSFPGEYRESIVVHGSNGSRVIKVEQIPHEQSEDYMKSLAATG
ncbi:MAG: hypothetical protein ACHQHO_07485 [Solirubrobacterales bacterium]